MENINNSNDDNRSNSIFDSLNLNPNIFINESLNCVDDVIDGAFHHFHQVASDLLLGANQDDVHRSNDLNKGVALLKYKVQSVLDKRLNLWERYCLSYCFSLPDGFSLPKDAGLAGDNSIDQNLQRDRELDEQLDSLRNEIASVVKETAERNKELYIQKRKSELNSQLASSIDEASQLYDQYAVIFEEVKKTAAEIREKTEQQSKTLKLAKHRRIERLNGPIEDTFWGNRIHGLSNVTVEELEEFIADINPQTVS